jgi:hypothetical protein
MVWMASRRGGRCQGPAGGTPALHGGRPARPTASRGRRQRYNGAGRRDPRQAGAGACATWGRYYLAT